MNNAHTCYMEGGSIINGYTGSIIEEPAILVSKEADVIHGWGETENVKARFAKYVLAYTQAYMNEERDDLMLIELSQYKLDREKACYIIRRATEFTHTGFIHNLCRVLIEGKDPVAWLEYEMKRIPIDLNEKVWC